MKSNLLRRALPLLLLCVLTAFGADAQKAGRKPAKAAKKTHAAKAKPGRKKAVETKEDEPVATKIEAVEPAKGSLNVARRAAPGSGETARGEVSVVPMDAPRDGDQTVAPPPPPDYSAHEQVFSKVEIEAEFPGGRDSMTRYLQRNLVFPEGAPGGVYVVPVQFIVDTDGSISEVKALRDPGFGFAREAVRVIKQGPKWKPAMQNGRMVRAYRTQPISFVVSK